MLLWENIFKSTSGDIQAYYFLECKITLIPNIVYLIYYIAESSNNHDKKKSNIIFKLFGIKSK